MKLFFLSIFNIFLWNGLRLELINKYDYDNAIKKNKQNKRNRNILSESFVGT